jgi:hypothetical protein
MLRCISVGCAVGVFYLICQHKLSQERKDKGYKNNSPKSKHRHKMHSNVRDGGEGADMWYEAEKHPQAPEGGILIR